MEHAGKPSTDRAVLLEVGEDSDLQRLDNYLIKICKGVPKSHIFRIIRSGEVRVNRSRAEAKTRLKLGDVVRVPPIRTASREEKASLEPTNGRLHPLVHKNLSILFEDECLLAVNKPAGIAVHGGSGQSLGVIESLRIQRDGQDRFLELVHRIDRETSGILLVAKKRSALRVLQEQLRARSWKKYYLALVLGSWSPKLAKVELPLLKTQASELEKKVIVDSRGDASTTLFKQIARYQFQNYPLTLVRAQILTGRTHQIRVHTSANNCPILGDDRYGDFELNKLLSKNGLKRMFLHATRVILTHPRTNELLELNAPLAPELQSFLDSHCRSM